jgi:hypothetical protein
LFVQQAEQVVEVKQENESDAGDHSQLPSHGDSEGQGHGSDDDESSDAGDHSQPQNPEDSVGRGDKGDDSDSDCMIIDSEEVPDDVKAKFAEFKYGQWPGAAPDVICTGSVAVKVEEQDDNFPLFSDDADDEADPDFRMDEDNMLSDGERPKTPRPPRPGVKRRRRQDGSPEVEAWKEPTEEELMDLCMRQEELNALKSQGSLSLSQTLELARVTARIAAVEAMAKQERSTPVSRPRPDDRDEDDEVREELNRALAVTGRHLPRAPARETGAGPALARGDAGAEEQRPGQAGKAKLPRPKSARDTGSAVTPKKALACGR